MSCCSRVQLNKVTFPPPIGSNDVLVVGAFALSKVGTRTIGPPLATLTANDRSLQARQRLVTLVGPQR